MVSLNSWDYLRYLRRKFFTTRKYIPCFDEEIIVQLKICLKISSDLTALQTQTPIEFEKIPFGAGPEALEQFYKSMNFFQCEKYGKNYIEVRGFQNWWNRIPAKCCFIFHNNIFIAGVYVIGVDSFPRMRTFGDVIIKTNYHSNLRSALNAFCKRYTENEVPLTGFYIAGNDGNLIQVKSQGLKLFIYMYPPISEDIEQMLRYNKKCKKILSSGNKENTFTLEELL